jgi:hypothetical protein
MYLEQCKFKAMFIFRRLQAATDATIGILMKCDNLFYCFVDEFSIQNNIIITGSAFVQCSMENGFLNLTSNLVPGFIYSVQCHFHTSDNACRQPVDRGCKQTGLEFC